MHVQIFSSGSLERPSNGTSCETLRGPKNSESAKTQLVGDSYIFASADPRS